MSARANAIVPVAPEKLHSFGGLEEEDRRAIQTVAKKVKSIHAATMFSTKTLPSRVIVKFVGIPSIGIEDLRLINISNHNLIPCTTYNQEVVWACLQRPKVKVD